MSRPVRRLTGPSLGKAGAAAPDGGKATTARSHPLDRMLELNRSIFDAFTLAHAAVPYLLGSALGRNPRLSTSRAILVLLGLIGACEVAEKSIVQIGIDSFDESGWNILGDVLVGVSCGITGIVRGASLLRRRRPRTFPRSRGRAAGVRGTEPVGAAVPRGHLALPIAAVALQPSGCSRLAGGGGTPDGEASRPDSPPPTRPTQRQGISAILSRRRPPPPPAIHTMAAGFLALLGLFRYGSDVLQDWKPGWWAALDGTVLRYLVRAPSDGTIWGALNVQFFKILAIPCGVACIYFLHRLTSPDPRQAQHHWEAWQMRALFVGSLLLAATVMEIEKATHVFGLQMAGLLEGERAWLNHALHLASAGLGWLLTGWLRLVPRDEVPSPERGDPPC